MAYSKTSWFNFPATTSPINATNLNKIETGVDKAISGVENGWNLLTGTFTYASADTPTFVMNTPSDLTGVISLGMRIKLTQTTVKYFIVTAITSTTITLYGGTDYSLVNETISNIYYSMVKAPFGFPTSPEKWSVISTYGAGSGQANPVANTWYSTPLSLVVPIGSWNIIGNGTGQVNSTSTTAVRIKTAISTSNNSVNDLKNVTFAGYNIPTAGSQNFFSSSPIEFDTILTSKTPFYFLMSTTMAGAIGLTLVSQDSANTAYIKATCAYL